MNDATGGPVKGHGMTGIALALIAAVATALSHVLAKDSLHRQDMSAFLIVRTAAATAVLAVIFFARGGLAELRAMPSDLIWLLIGAGLLCPFAVNILYFAALKRLPVNVVTPVYGCQPAIAFLLGLVLLRSQFIMVNALGVLAVVAGAAGFCLPRSGSGEYGGTNTLGITLTLLGALLMALATILWKVLQTRASVTAICFLGISAATAALLACSAWRFPVMRWGGAATNAKTALSGVLVFGLGNVLAIMAMKNLSPAVVYAIVSSSILWVGVLAFFMLKEKWTLLQVAAAALICSGIAVLALGHAQGK